MAEDSKSDVAKREEEILKFWQENRVFEKTLEKEAPKGEFVFYDGPPFATGTPHSGSLLSSVSKDVVPRYKTMRGYRVRRRWGWDTHGLPIESLVEKKLGLKNKKEILAIGIEKFNETARSMVLEYVSEWKRYVERVGRWVDFDNSYKTMDNTFIESVWWALKKIHDKGRLYEGRKVLMYCPHCETPLAKAEIAMDNTYKDITEEAVTVRFQVKEPEKYGLPQNTFILAWTTTPWTLPGNVALAVGPDIVYSLVRQGEENLIVASERRSALGIDGNLLKEVKGSDLIGVAYEPLYAIENVKSHESSKKWTVLSADFVTTTDGTGIVHTAVIYGEDDYGLGLKEGLPMVPLLNPNGTYNDDAPEFLRGKYIKKAEVDIKADLESRGLLFRKENNTHSYPHCYRCGTPLIYNAVSSWFINIQAIKDTMLSENEKIAWIPDHLKHGRFKKIIESAPDWTISRNRFWASPLPIWKDPQGNVTVIGSLEELKQRTKRSGNTYVLMRHGEAENNTGALHLQKTHVSGALTDKGKQQAIDAAAALREQPDIIIASPYVRTRETATSVASALGYKNEVLYDDRLREWDVRTIYEGKSRSEMKQYYDLDYLKSPEEEFTDGESFADVVRRAGDFIYEIERKYSGKKILIITHSGVMRALLFVQSGKVFSDLKRDGTPVLPSNGEVIPFQFVPLPHNAKYELDFHLPYIDQIELENEKGVKLTRIPEVVDCWVESGSMPFAEYHYPFENKAEFEKRSPGDFVSEYIGQTRAWFYYMHAVSVSLFGRQSFRNVITTGNINAADGQKLSKSKKNYTDPYVLFDKFGADAFRYYLMSSVVMQAEDLQFKDDDVKEVQNRILNILRNTNAFYLLYKDETGPAADTSDAALDRWILARLRQLSRQMTEAFDGYDVIRATRPIREFVEDFSTWYVRRSRDRVKGEDLEDKKKALATMRYVLLTLSKLIAPITPFVAEEIYGSVKAENDPMSVHLCAWPETSRPIFANIFGVKSEHLIADMAEVRRVVSLALEKRSSANIKVRQPLAELKVKSRLLLGKPELVRLVEEEINVKKVVVDPSLPEDVVLDTVITPQLKEEGIVREVVRFVQELRKEAGFHPKDKAVLRAGNDETRVFLETHWGAFEKTANAARLEAGTASHTVEVEGFSLVLDVGRA